SPATACQAIFAQLAGGDLPMHSSRKTAFPRIRRSHKSLCHARDFAPATFRAGLRRQRFVGDRGDQQRQIGREFPLQAQIFFTP
ncbi:MAG TPA: hypothetical protein VMB73_32315, partial [Acetobacteraceae bacterium]|nr:hypothetical protein [Acetobacteraceae bacterium]